MEKWKEKHQKIIHQFLSYLNQRSDEYILKGGTSLITCYNMPRFSEYIDLDSLNKNKIKNIIDDYCSEHNYSYRIAKNTTTTQRYMIHYSQDSKPLKVEISFRRKSISKDEIDERNGIKVYTINSLCLMKSNAYSARDKIRDMYDLSFIVNNYEDELDKTSKQVARLAVENKGLEQYDYLVREQHDESIDNDELAENFLLMLQELDLDVKYDEISLEEKIDTLNNRRYTYGIEQNPSLIYI